MQWAAWSFLLPLIVERGGSCPRLRVDADDRVQRRAALVVGLDACEIKIDELPRSHLSICHRALKLFDRLLHHVEDRRCGAQRGCRLTVQAWLNKDETGNADDKGSGETI